MKKAIYIWMLCLGGLFFSQQSFAQRAGQREDIIPVKPIRKHRRIIVKAMQRLTKTSVKIGRIIVMVSAAFIQIIVATIIAARRRIIIAIIITLALCAAG
ncbi:hypothetical protein FSB73_15850 [Arachidicoccus ginsenosidivorans]|uniref:Uncharacterized protein n=1 Tax=Arachidicoccus ginsenosidivorans TaxID=496057 RepID=A0A5B8VMZ7_9BACT|nr:hypothetical protein [Arachidicoccus ginsenosidivorans]QEC72934.1 hypothetical protein FSB73_15850 [Arachidicoccus ginsenosidivorans]